jgi:hypothetical protein
MKGMNGDEMSEGHRGESGKGRWIYLKSGDICGLLGYMA